MSEKIYEDAFKYAMDELHKEYIEKDKENDFIFNFNVDYVEDTIDTITVSVASIFMKNQVTNKGSLKIIEEKLKQVTGLQNLQINCVIKNAPAQTSTPETPKNEKNVKIEKEDKKEEIPALKKKHPLLQEKYTFETFIPGDNSKFAYNASLTVAKNPGKQYNPILLYGGSGLGKTHLMQAIGNYIYQNSTEKLKICYISAESFTNEFLDSLKTKKTNEFKNKYRNLDILLLDDIHFLQNKEQTQEELFYTFNALNDRQAQMVFTCDRPIKEIKNMAARLVSRLSNGLCIDLQPPNYETRLAILQKKIELMGKSLNSEVVDYIAKNVETNVRELETALQTVFGYAELVGENPTLETTKNILKNILNSNSNENISLDVIQKVIADNYQISIYDLKSQKRDHKYTIPRKIAIYIARELTELSYTELGNEFGGKDHSTIMTAYRKIADQIKTDPTLESKIQLFIREIKEYKR